MDTWRIRDGELSLTTPQVMGILNVTPDSFSDGGRYNTPPDAVAHACAMVEAGATLLDIGAQSTRPGAELLSAEDEWRRLAPCLEAVLSAVTVPVSVDTFWPQVADKALSLGAHIINDVSGSEQNGMAAVAASHGAGMIFMRSGNPAERTATAEETLAAAKAYFARVPSLAAAGGLAPESVCLDVGIGFGSSVEGDLALIAHLDEITASSRAAVLVGASRKRVVSAVCPREEDRSCATAALHTVALRNGCHILRVHDVAAAVATVKMVTALRKGL